MLPVVSSDLCASMYHDTDVENNHIPDEELVLPAPEDPFEQDIAFSN